MGENQPIIAYYRVSTKRQGESGLGLEAQRTAVAELAASRGARITEEFVEVESGKRDDRPQLAEALHLAKLTRATLVIAKLDRLSRNATFLSSLLDSGASFVAADMPDANDLTIRILAAVAQQEREAISKRTKEALRAAKARGVKLGNPYGAAALIRDGSGPAAASEARKEAADQRALEFAQTIGRIKAQGKTSLREIAEELNRRGIHTARGGQWHPTTVRNYMQRAAACA